MRWEVEVGELIVHLEAWLSGAECLSCSVWSLHRWLLSPPRWADKHLVHAIGAEGGAESVGDYSGCEDVRLGDSVSVCVCVYVCVWGKER